MKRAPLLNILLPFVAGIIATFHFTFALLPTLLVGAGLLAAVVAMTFVPALRKLHHSLFQLTLACFFVSMGIAMVALRDPYADPQHYIHHTETDGRYRMRLLVDDTPVERARSYRVRARMLQVGGADTTVQTCGQVMLYLRKDSLAATLCYGDLLEAEGQLTLPVTAERPGEFDYREYLWRKGFARQCWLERDRWQRVGHRNGGLMGWSKALQRRLVGRLQQSGLPHAQQGIAEALLLGWRGDLEEETQAQFRDAGILHLLCVSGLHVGIVAALIGMACRPLRRRGGQVATALLQLAGIWLFVAMTGMAPATLRAGVMFSLFVMARLFERSNNSFNTLSAAALLLLFIRPMLIVDTGFQLSFAAVFGIALLYQPFCRLIPLPHPKNRSKNRVLYTLRQQAYRLWQLACLSTAAQLGTLPFTLYHFHQLTPYFLIANISVVPLAGVLVGTTLLLVLTTPLPLVEQGVAWLLGQELNIVEAITRWIQQLPGAVVDNVYCDMVTAALIAAWIVALALWLRHHGDSEADGTLNNGMPREHVERTRI